MQLLEQNQQLLQRLGLFLERFLKPFRSSWVVAALVIASVFAGVTFLRLYVNLSRIVDSRLARGPFAGTMNVFAAPERFAVGDPATSEAMAERLLHAGYARTAGAGNGWFAFDKNTLTLTPGVHESRHSFRFEFAGGRIKRIVTLPERTEREQIALEPRLITNISDRLERRKLVRFGDIPLRVVQAVTSAEDKYFFDHSGIDLPRVVKAAYIDMKSGRKEQGASTLTMQLVRNFWLKPDKSWHRKVKEMLLAFNLERRLTKQQIFEYYANQVYLGRRDPFSVNGFAEGAQAFFNKDLSQLTAGEAAVLAGLVQRPSYYNPLRYPARCRERRDVVLGLMHRNGYLTDAEYQAAVQAPLGLNPSPLALEQNHYFVDLVRDQVYTDLEGSDRARRDIYTTLDPDLQQAAEEAVRLGMEKLDRVLRGRKNGEPPGQPQVALIALDPHTGEVKALIGGRNYHVSQLNHASAMRQPGSVFKPFVYTTALETGLSHADKVFTPASIVSGDDVSIHFNGHDYQPHNFHGETAGDVTLRYALAHSLNTATVSLASQIGYDRVVHTALRMGWNDGIRATPSVALGAYEATPLQVAGAYTPFANGGLYTQPRLVSEVRAADGEVLFRGATTTRPALDPRVAYLMVDMMEEVLRSGTGAAVRGLGVTQPAAGKTGTSRDGWFAGFTSQLLCVVWVGYDDNRDLNLEGARSALPIWAEFMRRAAQIAPYNAAKPFTPPAGIRSVEVCAEGGDLAGSGCSRVRNEVFIDGTQPARQCTRHVEPPVIRSTEDAPSAAPSVGAEPSLVVPQPAKVPPPASPPTQPAPATQPPTVAPAPFRPPVPIQSPMPMTQPALNPKPSPTKPAGGGED
jgi:penicillin-binding protein 1B